MLEILIVDLVQPQHPRGRLTRRRHLFLDRDGTLIREENYLRDPAKVVLENDVLKGLREFARADYRMVVVSNQSGIGRGIITPDELTAVNSRLADLLSNDGITIAAWHHCPHRPDESCACRKPRTSMFQDANMHCPVDWGNSIMVGDKPSDVEAGNAMGMLSVLVATGYGSQHVAWAHQQGVLVVNSLHELASCVLH